MKICWETRRWSDVRTACPASTFASLNKGTSITELFSCLTPFLRYSLNIIQERTYIGRNYRTEAENGRISLSVPSDVIWFLLSEGNAAVLFPRLSTAWEVLWMGEWSCQRVFASLSVTVAEAAQPFWLDHHIRPAIHTADKRLKTLYRFQSNGQLGADFK